MAHGMKLIVFSVISLVGGSPKMQCYDNFCWKDASYPSDKINKELRSSEIYDMAGHLENPSGDVKDIQSCGLCESKFRMKIQPLSIIDGEKKYFIVNSMKYKQTEIEINVCGANQRQSKCVTGWQHPLDFNMGCGQKFTIINVLAYDEIQNEFVGKNFSYPSACECILKK
ncbi:hypothetical protein JTB14_025796 [Gonioctena quinquepunctata]|nr:hypothetical protein JTB14_025796 [Gonioctena quinquepunctata]